MIENFLLDPHAIWEAIQSVIERTGFSAIEDVEAAIDSLLNAAKDREIDRRALHDVGARLFRPHAPLQDISVQVAEFISEISTQYSPDRIRIATEQARSKVESLEAEKRRREHYDGKAILDDFSKLYLRNSGMSRGIFLYEAARHARQRRSVSTFFDNFHAQLRSRDIGATQQLA